MRFDLEDISFINNKSWNDYIKVIPIPKKNDNKRKTYKVNKGDSMWKIANDNKISLEELQDMNPQIKNNLIHPEDNIYLDYDYDTKLIDIINEERKYRK